MSRIHTISREGTTQKNRYPGTLEPDYVSAEEWSFRDLLTFASKFSRLLRFYNDDDAPAGDWSGMFAPGVEDILAYVEDPACFAVDPDASPDERMAQQERLDHLSMPHLALFLAFLKLLGHQQKQFAELTRRHLDFYYRQVLKLSEKPQVPDRVHMLFEPASGADGRLLPKGTLLRAGYDSRGIALHYATDDDIMVTRARVADLKRFKTLGGPPPLQAEEKALSRHFSPGFAIASPLFLLREGIRTVTLTLALQKDGFNRPDIEETLRKNSRPFDIFVGSADQWIGVDPKSTKIEVGDFVMGKPIRSDNKERLSLICTSMGDRFSQDDVGSHIVFRDGMIYMIVKYFNARKAALSYENKIGEYYADKMLPELSLEGSCVEMAGLRLRGDKKQIRISEIEQQSTADWFGGPIKKEEKKPTFTDNDDGKFIVFTDGYVYAIERVLDEERVEVSHWGTIPGYEDSKIKKYDRIGFKEQNAVPDLTDISITGFYTDAANLTESNIGQIIVWDNGKAFKIQGIASSREAAVTYIGAQPANSNMIKTYPAFEGLGIRFSFGRESPPLSPPGPGVLIDGMDAPYPVVKVALRNFIETDLNKESVTNYYEQFRSLRVQKVDIRVDVEKISDFDLRSDDSILSAKTPFEPYGGSPAVGSGFYFSGAEICRNKLDNISMDIEWMNRPDDFEDHYAAYSQCGLSPSPPALDDHSFKVRLKMFNNRTWTDIEGPKSLFSGSSQPGEDNKILWRDFDRPGYGMDLSMGGITSGDPLALPRHFKLELESPDFQHEAYPLVLNSVADARDRRTGALTVNPPYTPKVKAISLGWASSLVIDLTDNDQGDAKDASFTRMVQIHPFGCLDLQHPSNGDDKAGSDYLLPQLKEEGSLLIGLTELKAGQDISLLFQLAPGSGDPGVAEAEVNWTYLSNNVWKAFGPDELLSDTTDGLTDTGIIRFRVPGEWTSQNSLLPTGLYWLRAGVKDNAVAIPDVLDIKSQAVRACFVDQGNAPDHLKRPLAGHTINELAEDDPAIGSVAQPYSSFGGRMKEDARAFYARVSERLRHKQRALTTWDYERLALERFPEIFQAKCLNRADMPEAAGSAHVTVVVVPDISNTAPFFPLEPKAPFRLLKKIETYLDSHTSPFVRVTVKNPRYEQITYRVAVRFRKEFGEGHYLNQLNEEIKRLLSPWAYEADVTIPFGSVIYNSSLIQFVESRPYVDYVAKVKLFEQVSIGEGPEERSLYRHNVSNVARVRHADSILVSAPQHVIDVIATEEYHPEDFEGVGYLIVELDFEVF
ncbi:MAG: hypothetical protein GY849_15830 [Deltaproteobacteria bacterium]|nr:hypothetical protein [Deltaproteobacteria bacterium]